jgi:hypothetical protein
MPTFSVTNYAPLPKDTYRLRITDCKLLTNKQDPTKQFLGWKLVVVDEGSEFEGKTMDYSTSLAFGPKSKAYAFLLAAGLDPAVDTTKDFQLNSDEFLNAEFYGQVNVIQDTKGNDKNSFEALWTLAEYQIILNKAVARASAVHKPVVAAPARTPAPAAGVKPQVQASAVRKPVTTGTVHPGQPSGPVKRTPPANVVAEQQPQGSDLDFPEEGTEDGATA